MNLYSPYHKPKDESDGPLRFFLPEMPVQILAEETPEGKLRALLWVAADNLDNIADQIRHRVGWDHPLLRETVDKLRKRAEVLRDKSHAKKFKEMEIMHFVARELDYGTGMTNYFNKVITDGRKDKGSPS